MKGLREDERETGDVGRENKKKKVLDALTNCWRNREKVMIWKFRDDHRGFVILVNVYIQLPCHCTEAKWRDTASSNPSQETDELSVIDIGFCFVASFGGNE